MISRQDEIEGFSAKRKLRFCACSSFPMPNSMVGLTKWVRQCQNWELFLISVQELSFSLRAFKSLNCIENHLYFLVSTPFIYQQLQIWHNIPLYASSKHLKAHSILFCSFIWTTWSVLHVLLQSGRKMASFLIEKVPITWLITSTFNKHCDLVGTEIQQPIYNHTSIHTQRR